MRTFRALGCAAMVCLSALNVLADEEPATSVVLETPDFSKEALLKLVENEDVTVEVYEDRLEMRWAEWVLRFLPIVLPLTPNDGAYGSANIHGPVSGLALLGVDYPLAGPAADEYAPFDVSWGERRFRSQMIRRVNAMNALDNR